MKTKILLLWMMLLTGAVASFAQESGRCGENLTWTLTDDGMLTISGTGEMTNYSDYDTAPWNDCRIFIETVIIEEGATSIGDYAFSVFKLIITGMRYSDFHSCETLTSVTIPESVTSIGERAFSDCSNLTSVAIPNSVSNIGVEAFSGCTGLTSVTVPDGVTSIEDYTFSYCHNLASVTIPNGVTSIGNYAFGWCSSLTSFSIPVGVTSIGDYAFAECYNLTAIDVSENNAAYASENGVLFNKEKTTLIQYPKGKTDTNYAIPGSVTDIGARVFSDCRRLTLVTIPESVTNIGDYVFYNCTGLTSIIIPNNVTSIGEWAFFYCNSLTSVIIPNSVTSIGARAFAYCGNLTAIDVLENNTAYASENGVLFNKAKTTLIQYPAGKPDANYEIPGSVTNIGDYAFSDCIPLTSVTIDNSVESIGNYAFQYCQRLTSVTIGNSVTSIGNYAFHGCQSLALVTVGNSVTRIGERAFLYCGGLTSVTIGSSVATIGLWAFRFCSSLTSVTNLSPTPQEIGLFTLQYVPFDRATLYVPAQSIAAYKAADTWRNFKTITAAPTAIDAPSVASAIRVYPDPAAESFRISGVTGPAQVTVTDANGRIVFRKTVAGNEPISAGHWPQGIYLINVNGKTVKAVKTF